MSAVPQATRLPRTPDSSCCVKPNYLPTTVTRTNTAANNPIRIRERDNTRDFLSRCPWPCIICLIAVPSCLVSKEKEKTLTSIVVILCALTLLHWATLLDATLS